MRREKACCGRHRPNAARCGNGERRAAHALMVYAAGAPAAAAPPDCLGSSPIINLTAVRAASRMRRKLRMVGHLAAPPRRPPPTPLLRTLTVQFVEVNRLSDIDILAQRFKAEFVVQFAFVGGASDANLSDQNAGFPLDAYNRPTFRPSAAWYMAQVDFNNALEYKQLDARIQVSGSDLLMLFRFEGTFSEVMELEDFPCDVQDLTISMCFNCRTTGMMPLQVITSPDLSTGISRDGFVDGRKWNLHDQVGVKPGVVGLQEDRKFPSVELGLLVGRQPLFFLLNLAMPVFFFAPIAMLQFCVPRDNTEGCAARLRESVKHVWIDRLRDARQMGDGGILPCGLFLRPHALLRTGGWAQTGTRTRTPDRTHMDERNVTSWLPRDRLPPQPPIGLSRHRADCHCAQVLYDLDRAGGVIPDGAREPVWTILMLLRSVLSGHATAVPTATVMSRQSFPEDRADHSWYLAWRPCGLV